MTDLAALIDASRTAQGKPLRVTNPQVLAQAARLVRQTLRPAAETTPAGRDATSRAA